MSALSTLAAEPLLPQFDATKPEVMVSAALYLMSSYGCGGGCPKLAHVILKHLRILAEREDLAPVLRDTCARLVEQWEVTLHEMLPAARQRSTSARIFSLKRNTH
ncbi:MAG TPA: hypothetical protein VH105_14545 [Burkholderiales bacterium]|jgi:hypothetical protein|nr:hypothetical protein [Burkholderiales bacterium]